MIVISVVRNKSMYEDFFEKNSNYTPDTKFICYDNSTENISIPVRYNTFLNSYDYSREDWFLFIHEDWQLLQKINKKMDKLNKDFIYGVSGCFYNEKDKIKYLYGHIIQSNKDGSKKIKYGLKIPFNRPLIVDTVDCQCFIIHSSLIKRYNLRFDDKLMFDLYSEEFSMNAKENYNIKTKVVPIKCHHYSYGNPTQNYYESIKYLEEKYKNKKHTYATTCSDNLIGKPVKGIKNLDNLQRLKRKLNKIINS